VQDPSNSAPNGAQPNGCAIGGAPVRAQTQTVPERASAALGPVRARRPSIEVAKLGADLAKHTQRCALETKRLAAAFILAVLVVIVFSITGYTGMIIALMIVLRFSQPHRAGDGVAIEAVRRLCSRARRRHDRRRHDLGWR
jgi:hypothetical protein